MYTYMYHEPIGIPHESNLYVYLYVYHTNQNRETNSLSSYLSVSLVQEIVVKTAIKRAIDVARARESLRFEILPPAFSYDYAHLRERSPSVPYVEEDTCLWILTDAFSYDYAHLRERSPSVRIHRHVSSSSYGMYTDMYPPPQITVCQNPSPCSACHVCVCEHSSASLMRRRIHVI
jgi:hypothetical protein